MVKKHKLHNHPRMERILTTELGAFKCIVDVEFKDLFHWYKEVSGDSTHIIVKMCEYLEQTMPACDLGDIVRTGTKVRITKCLSHPEYVGKEGYINEWIAFDTDTDNTLYAIVADGEELKGLANRSCFDIIHSNRDFNDNTIW